METITAIIITTLLVLLLSIWYSRRGISRIPGPWGVPILGYLLFLTRKPHLKIHELAKTFGPLFRIKLGSQNVVVICDYNLIKQAFQKEAFNGRPKNMPFDVSKRGLRALTEADWSQHRRFSLQMLRELGFGKSQMEDHMKEEIHELLQRLETQAPGPLEIGELLAPSTSNNIASLIIGRRMKYTDPQRIEMDGMLTTMIRLGGILGWQVFFPWIGMFYAYFQIGKKGELAKTVAQFKDMIRREMETHESTLDPNNVRDFIDGYLLEIEKTKLEDPNTLFHKDVLIDFCRVLMAAGSDVVRTAVEWTLLVAAGKPAMQEKMHQEIAEVLGGDRFPTWQDHLEMPYTEAVICEAMRWPDLVPLNIMRYTLEDTDINGYFIPKNTHVLANLYSVSHDKLLWGDDVNVFRPERFLSKDGTKVVKPEYFIPFSLGKRQCPGKTLAEIEVFLYTVAILQKFRVSVPQGKTVNYDGVLGLSYQPVKQGLVFSQRKY